MKLQDRDRNVIKHIARYRMTVKEALLRMPCFENSSEEVVKKALGRLRRGGYVSSKPLYENRSYWHLTPRGANEALEHERLGAPLKEEPKRRAFAILSFCCLGDTPRTRLTPREFKEKFPSFYVPGDRVDYYLDKERKVARLGYIRVDSRGLSSRWTRIIGQLHRDIQKRADRPAFRDLILQRRFAIAVLTATEEKAERLQELVDEQNFPPEIELKFHVIPELIPLGDPLPKPA